MFWLIIFSIFINVTISSDEIKQPIQPQNPVPPTQPIVPGASNNTGYPKFPPLPSFPSIQNNNQNKDIVEIENYELIISSAFPNGDTSRNVSSTIKKAQYIFYSNNDITLKLDFINDLQYVYYLKNSKGKMETSPGIYREIYDTLVQVGKNLLLDQYSSEIYKQGEEIKSITIIGNDKVIVTINVTKKI
jgi:hypothetical protein